MSTYGSQRDEGFYLCHFELLTLEVLLLHPKGVFPWDTISLSPSCMNKHVFAPFLIYKIVFLCANVHQTCKWSWVKW